MRSPMDFEHSLLEAKVITLGALKDLKKSNTIHIHMHINYTCTHPWKTPLEAAADT